MCIRDRIHLFEEDNRGAQVFAFLTFGAKFVPDFSGAEQEALGILRFRVRNYGQEFLMRQVFQLSLIHI